MTAQGHMLELNHVDESKDAKARISELSIELEALRLAKTESGNVCMPCSILRNASCLHEYSNITSYLILYIAASFHFLFTDSYS